MTSCGPYWQAQNYTHMFDIPDIRGPLPIVKLCPGSIASIINDNPDFSAFNFILRLSGLQNIYNGLQANCTLFVPSNSVFKDTNFIKNMDRNTAINIVRNSTLDKIITKDIIQESPASIFTTRNNPNNLFIQNISGISEICPNIHFLQFNIRANNGIIHVIDKLIIPDVVL